MYITLLVYHYIVGKRDTHKAIYAHIWPYKYIYFVNFLHHSNSEHNILPGNMYNTTRNISISLGRVYYASNQSVALFLDTVPSKVLDKQH